MTAIAYNKETLIGTSIISAVLVVFWAVDIELVLFAVLQMVLGVVAVYLYEMRVYTARQFYFIKVPLNILFNEFLIVLLIKSWTMRLFKEDFEMLDKNIQEYKDRKIKEILKDIR